MYCKNCGKQLFVDVNFCSNCGTHIKINISPETLNKENDNIMNSTFPTIGEYNQVIQKKGGNAFRLLNGITLIHSRTSPIKGFFIWLWGICCGI